MWIEGNEVDLFNSWLQNAVYIHDIRVIVIQISYLFWVTACLIYQKSRAYVESYSCDVGFIIFVILLLLKIFFEVILLGERMFKIVTSSWWVEAFNIIVTFFISFNLKTVLFCINIIVLFWLHLLFYPFISNL